MATGGPGRGAGRGFGILKQLKQKEQVEEPEKEEERRVSPPLAASSGGERPKLVSGIEKY